jgi:hypothetical protein
MTPTIRHTGRRTQIAVAAIGIAAATVPILVSGPATIDTTAPPPAARPADVDSIGAILRAAYDANSGPAGSIDWQRLRSLFAPGARLIPSGRDSAGHWHMRALSVNQYVSAAAKGTLTHGNYEHEIGRKVDSFGAIAQVFSAYAWHGDANDKRPPSRGVNSFQLFYDGTRWYIVTIYWNAERPGLTIPAEYLNENSNTNGPAK